MAARMMALALAVFLSQPLSAASLPDPTALPKILSSPDAAGAHEEAVLAWVRVNGRDSIAWFGGTTVKLGEQVDGGRVSAILEDHIVISGKNGRRSVYLLDHSIRTQPQVRSPRLGKTRK
jgi:hypothetical protein